MKIKVTQKNIKDGEKENAEKCAIALAIKDALKKIGFKNADIEVASTNENTVSFSVDFAIPAKAKKFISLFDQQKPNPLDYEDGKKSAEYIKDMKKYDQLRSKLKPFDFEAKN